VAHFLEPLRDGSLAKRAPAVQVACPVYRPAPWQLGMLTILHQPLHVY
jgi:hypothetical protein